MKYLILDCNGLCHRAFHTTGELKYRSSFGDRPTGTTYGFLSAILNLQRDLHCENMIFCFDKGDSIRKEMLPEYKKKRKALQKKWTEAEQKAYAGMYRQIKELRKTHLKTMGYRNVFYREGYEADDIIASICKYSLVGHTAIIVSQDSDMFQLISKRVKVYNPRSKVLWDRKHFREVYGIKPKQWVLVKALGGCNSDEICGIKGIGEGTALKYVKDELPETSKKYKLITSKEGYETRMKMIPLVKLPIEGTPTYKIRKDKKISWDHTKKILGIKSLIPRLHGLEE